MPSPFPGMDPYLESHWGDVHQGVIIYARDQLRPLLPRDLRARVQERVFVELDIDEKRPIVPDIRVVERRGRKTAASSSVALLTPAEPIIVPLDEPITQGFIEILDAATGFRVVTAIEVLSLSNKVPGEGQTKYLQKQRELREGRASLVAIDLLRAGPWSLPVAPTGLPPLTVPPTTSGFSAAGGFTKSKSIISPFKSGCPSFAFRCGRRTATFLWICKRRSISAISMEAMTTTWIMKPTPIRLFEKRMRIGRIISW